MKQNKDQQRAVEMIKLAKPWNETEAAHYHNTALQCLKHSYDHASPDPDNCGGCALRIGNSDGPNYAGWQRVYVEAGWVIPAKWRKAFFAAFASENRPFAEALARSCNTWSPLID